MIKHIKRTWIDFKNKLMVRLLPKTLKPDIILNKVSDLDDNMIASLKQRYKIEGIILDVDETLRKDMKPIPKCNKEWLEHLNKNIKVIVLSNGYDKSVAQYLNTIGIKYITLANKPMKKYFIKAAIELSVSTDKILVVGDSIFDDIIGGKRNDMITALVMEV